jgi:cytochrome P450
MATGDLAWLVTRYEDARFVLADPRFSKAALLEPDAPRIRPGALPPGLLFTTDPPEHTALRGRVLPAIGRDQLVRARAAFEEVAAELTDALDVGSGAARSGAAGGETSRARRAGGEADLVQAYARPLAMRVMCRILGACAEDCERYAYWAETVLTPGGPSHREVERAQRELMAHSAGLVAARRAEPTGDLVSALLGRACGEEGEEDAVATSLVATLVVTGYETLVAAIANSVVVLLAAGHGMPSPWPKDSRQLVEELLRLSTFGDALRSRRTTDDVLVGGTRIRAGEVVLVSLASANRDESVFPEPDRASARNAPCGHLAFGHGAHRCPGASLARVGLDIALGRLADRFPTMRLAVGAEEIVLRTSSAESPPERLPVLLRP